MKNPLITAAVIAALGSASSAVHALSIADTLAAPAQLIGAGASAARDNFLAELNNTVCVANSLTVYRAFPTPNQDFRAYSCTVTNAGTIATAFGAAAGQNLTVYYRSEGGSAWGPASIATSTQIQSLVVDNRCTAAGTIAAGSGTAPLFNCSVSSYVLANDTVGSGLTKRTTQLGVSDEEPNMYVDANYPGVTSSVFPAFSPTVQSQLNNLNRTRAFAQIFGVLVSNAGPTVGINSLTAAEVAGIFSGVISDWNDTVNPATGLSNPDGVVTVVRREAGSGTQVAGAHQFLSTTNCSPGGAAPFVVDTDAPPTAACAAGTPLQQFGGQNDTDRVLERGTTSDLETCIGVIGGSIGPNVFKSPGPGGNTHYVAINGVLADKFSAARGDYKFWYELTMQDGPGTTPVATAARSGLKTIMQRRASVPNTVSAMALPNASNTPVVPVPNTGVPISLSTKNGNSCALPVNGTL